MLKISNILIIVYLLFSQLLLAQVKVPAVYSNMSINSDNDLVLEMDSVKIVAKTIDAVYKVEDFDQAWEGSDNGLVFKSAKKNLNGTMYFGLIPFGDSKHPHPVYRSSRPIKQGEVTIDITQSLKGISDMVGWEKSGKGVIGYRVNNFRGRIIYDGIIGFSYDSIFSVDLTVLEGPFINLLTASGATMSFKTNKKTVSTILIDGKEFSDDKETYNHEIRITGLQSDKEYVYQMKYGNNMQEYSFRTAPVTGSRKPFIFGYASDCRSGNGGGERNIYGHNGYI